MNLADRAKAVLRRGGLDGVRRDAFLADGYLVLEGYLDAETCQAIVSEADRFYGQRGVAPERAERTMNFHQESSTARRVLRDQALVGMLSRLLGARAQFLQSIYFNRGSQQQSHTDYMYMGTDPALQLCGIWLACEDVTPAAGPLFYYPGSHHLPSETVAERYARRMPALAAEIRQNLESLGDFYRDRIALTGESLEVCVFFDEWLAEIAAGLGRDGFERVTFLPRRGDLMIWHANLVHGGLPVADPVATRRSLVAHYLTKSVRRYFDMNYVDTRAHLTLRSIDHDRPAVLQSR